MNSCRDQLLIWDSSYYSMGLFLIPTWPRTPAAYHGTPIHVVLFRPVLSMVQQRQGEGQTLSERHSSASHQQITVTRKE